VPAGTVLGLWAHPDDETFLSAGLMAAAVRQGSRVVCVTATRGEAGSTDPQRWPPGEPLAAVRTDELTQAMRVLGVNEHHWLDYPDGGCAAVPQPEVVSRLRVIANAVAPDIVVTFGPDGMTGHEDHRTVSSWADEVLRTQVDRRPRLLHAVHTEEWLAAHREILDAHGVFMGFEPVSVPRAEADVYLALDGAALDQKVTALSAQRSQTQGLFEALGPQLTRSMLAEEAFVDARP
jgi:LmbE family N-acetylglucosaminyl deacetylase